MLRSSRIYHVIRFSYFVFMLGCLLHCITYLAGQSLKKVEREEKSSANIFSGNDVAAILARSVVMMLSDSESECYTSDDDSEWDV